MKKAALLFVFLFFFFAGSYAQYYTNQNKVWAFGYNAGINFTSGVPVPFWSNIHTNEGSASVSDTAGSLLFYTDGRKVFNRTGAVMPSGDSIVHFGVSSTTQATVIVPVIGSATQYYIFSLEQSSTDSGVSRLAYSIVDMALAGGLGDILSGACGIYIDSQLSEKMTAVSGDSNNVWLLVHEKYNATFKAFSVNSTGIGSPVVTTYTTPAGYRNGSGCIICSPDRRKIITQSSTRGTEMYSFDPRTGVVSNRQVLDDSSTHACYGAEFSPDNKKMYSLYTLITPPFAKEVLAQYDISLATTTAIKASKKLISATSINNSTHLKLGPDNKIYLNRMSGLTLNYMDVINYPNLPGTSCGYVSHALMLSHGTRGYIGLPSVYVTPSKALREPTVNINSVNTFPNPADKQFTITLSGAAYSAAAISLYDISGKCINTYNIVNAHTIISTSNLPAGIYECEIEIEGKAVVYKKLVIAR